MNKTTTAGRRARLVIKPVFMAIMATLVLSATAFAAWSLLKPEQVAERANTPALAEAFKSGDAMEINETKSQNGYDVTLLGMVSGKGLSGYTDKVDHGSTYAVVAIANREGKASGDFFVSPLINGLEPWKYNIASMSGAYSEFEQDGVQYRLIECDNVEIFADKGISLCVSSTTFYDTEAYDYDAASGKVTPKAGYDGVNVLFDLPIDKAKADPAMAEEYINSLWQEEEAPADDANDAGDMNKVESQSSMGYDEFKAWSDAELEKLQGDVDGGKYSKANLAKDEQFYGELLDWLKEDANNKVEVILYEGGGHGIGQSGSSEFITDFEPDGNVVITER